jgi:hypothetical protein
MTKMYGRIDDGTVPGYKTTIGRIFSVQMSKTTQKTTGDKIGKTVDGGSLYYVTPGVYVLPRTKPYNYLVYKEGCVAPATHEIKFDRVMTMIDIVDGYRKLNIPAEDYRTQAEKLPRDECAICLSDEADWVCAGCFKGYACIECGRLDKCPLCRYDFN